MSSLAAMVHVVELLWSWLLPICRRCRDAASKTTTLLRLRSVNADDSDVDAKKELSRPVRINTGEDSATFFNVLIASCYYAMNPY
jgi:hypothetical protein